MPHTPGPWIVRGSYVFTADCRECVAGVYHDGDLDLLAAAPDLLAAGKRLKAAMGALVMAILNGQPVNPLEAEINAAQDTMIAAIAKAEGR